MYSYEWDSRTGGYILNVTPLKFSKEPRPVYYKELDILGFDKYWNYPKSDAYPLMWAESNNYYYRGRLVAKTKGGSVCTAPELVIIEEPEPNNGELKFVDVPAMVAKNHSIMESLTQETIKLIYNTYTKYRNKVDIFYVAFSGGKDSVVALDLVQRALPHDGFKVLFGDTKMEFPDTYKLVDEIKRKCESQGIEFIISRSNLDPENTWRQFGPPAQKIRWCCSVHKTAPQINMLRHILGKNDFRGMAFTGVRGDESASRSEYDQISLGEKVKGQYSCHPILEWNTAELFLYIYENNLILNEAYKKGNSRAGCLVCPLASNKNMFIKEKCYASTENGYRSTKTFNDIILDTTSKDLSNDAAVKEYMDIGGWKARRSGRELKGVTSHFLSKKDNDHLSIEIAEPASNWREWIKTVGIIEYTDRYQLKIGYHSKMYTVDVTEDKNIVKFDVYSCGNTMADIKFASALKTALKKAAYCIGCRVCEANCPNGYISFDNDGNVKIDDRCTKCKKCHEITGGCLVANSIKLPKGESKVMGSIDRYANMGIEFKWVKGYFDKKDDFWESDNGLGTKMVDSLKKFLSDAKLTTKNKLNKFGQLVTSMGIESETAWGLMLCNLAYTSQFNWWITTIEPQVDYNQEMLLSLMDSNLTQNSRSHVVSAFKNIFASNIILADNLGLGHCDYELKNGKRFLNFFRRTSWNNPDPKVVLYSLYKFAEACGDFKQFSLTRLLNYDIESEGISPTRIFGIERTEMERILNGLANNYPDFISVAFTLDLDNINLKDKTSDDVLKLFEEEY